MKVALLSQGANRFLGIEASGLGITATLPGFTGAITNGGVRVNRGIGAAAIDWTTIAGSGITLKTAVTGVSGTIATLAVGGLTGSTDFTIAKQTVAAGDLLTGTLSNLVLAAGSSTFGATITGTDVKFAVLSSGADRFTGIEASGLGITATLPGFTGTFSNGGVRVNTASGAATPIDWTTIAESGLTLNGAVIGVSGHIGGLTVAGSLTGSTDFAITKTTVAQGDLLTGKLTGLVLAAGSATFGASITGASVNVAFLSTPTARYTGIEASGLGITASLPGMTGTFSNGGVKVNSASAGAAVDWTTVTGSGLTLTTSIVSVSGDIATLSIAGALTGSATVALSRTLVTLPGGGEGELLTGTLTNFQLTAGSSTFGVTVQGDGVKIALLAPTAPGDNRRWTGIEATGLSIITPNLPGFSGTFTNGGVRVNTASTGVTPLDWTTLPASGLSLTAGITSVSGHIGGLTIANVLTGTTDFTITKSTVAQGELLTGLLSNLSLAAGDATFGVTVTGSNIAFALLKNASAQTFTGIEASGLGISATLPGFAATFQNGGVKVNTTAFDWTAVSGSGLTLTTQIIGVSGEMRGLTVAGVLTGQADFAIQKTTVTQGTLLSGELSQRVARGRRSDVRCDGDWFEREVRGAEEHRGGHVHGHRGERLEHQRDAARFRGDVPERWREGQHDGVRLDRRRRFRPDADDADHRRLGRDAEPDSRRRPDRPGRLRDSEDHGRSGHAALRRALERVARGRRSDVRCDGDRFEREVRGAEEHRGGDVHGHRGERSEHQRDAARFRGDVPERWREGQHHGLRLDGGRWFGSDVDDADHRCLG